MAKFNDELITCNNDIKEKQMKECGMFLQACLSKEENEKLHADWEAAGGFEVTPWWKFAFDNISVSYGCEAEK